jgi:hypothetical protein
VGDGLLTTVHGPTSGQQLILKPQPTSAQHSMQAAFVFSSPQLTVPELFASARTPDGASSTANPIETSCNEHERKNKLAMT